MNNSFLLLGPESQKKSHAKRGIVGPGLEFHSSTRIASSTTLQLDNVSLRDSTPVNRVDHVLLDNLVHRRKGDNPPALLQHSTGNTERIVEKILKINK